MPDDVYYSEMLLDTLATQPTPELAVMLLQLVQSGELSGLRASMMISTMSLVVKPTPAVILTALVRAAFGLSSARINDNLNCSGMCVADHYHHHHRRHHHHHRHRQHRKH